MFSCKMYMHIFIFYVFVALVDSQRFMRTPISTSTYGKSPIVSVTSIPSLSAVASQSASPSDSKTTRPSSSSLPSIRPSITQTPSARACDDYKKNSDDDDVEIPENCRPNKYVTALVLVMLFATFSLPIFVHRGLSLIPYNNLNCMQKIIFIIEIISSFSYYVYLCVLFIFALLKYNDKTIKYNDETQTLIATCVLAGLWILSLSCTLLICILTPPRVLSSDPAPESLNNGSGGSSNYTLNINECSPETGERKDLDLCPICQDNADLPRTTLSCTHSFHTKCINEWYKSCLLGRKIPTCPDCRAVMHTPVRGAGGRGRGRGEGGGAGGGGAGGGDAGGGDATVIK